MVQRSHTRRILLLATTNTYRAGAFLDAARRLGAPVVVGSNRPQVLAAANPAGHLILDFLDIDGSLRAILEFSKRYPIEAVIGADDESVLLAAAAAAALGLRHNPVAAVSAARNKLVMRERLSEAGIPSPGFARVPLDADPVRSATGRSYPCVLKPLFLSASRGVIRVDDPEQFVAAFRRIAAILRGPDVAAPGGEWAREILVEDYLPGTEVALEGLLTGGRLRALALFDKPDPLEGPFFEESIYVTPSNLGLRERDRITASAAEAAGALGLVEGPLHAELRVGPSGPRLLEIAPRSIGGLCSRTLRFGDGVSLEEVILLHALGSDVNGLERERAAAGVMMIPIPCVGVLRQVAGEEEARSVPGIEEIRLTIPIGQEVVPLPEGARYLGFIFARAESSREVEGALREAHRRLRFTIIPAGEPAETMRSGTPSP